MPRYFAAHCFAVFAVLFAYSADAFASEVVASWYGGKYHGRRTASGEIFDVHALTAAHASLPLGSEVEVRRLDDGRTVRVRVNDRCGRCGIDLSRAAADRLGLRRDGRALVALRPLAQVAWAD